MKWTNIAILVIAGISGVLCFFSLLVELRDKRKSIWGFRVRAIKRFMAYTSLFMIVTSIVIQAKQEINNEVQSLREVHIQDSIDRIRFMKIIAEAERNLDSTTRVLEAQRISLEKSVQIISGIDLISDSISSSIFLIHKNLEEQRSIQASQTALLNQQELLGNNQTYLQTSIDEDKHPLFPFKVNVKMTIDLDSVQQVFMNNWQKEFHLSSHKRLPSDFKDNGGEISFNARYSKEDTTQYDSTYYSFNDFAIGLIPDLYFTFYKEKNDSARANLTIITGREDFMYQGGRNGYNLLCYYTAEQRRMYYYFTFNPNIYYLDSSKNASLYSFKSGMLKIEAYKIPRYYQKDDFLYTSFKLTHVDFFCGQGYFDHTEINFDEGQSGIAMPWSKYYKIDCQEFLK